MQFPPPTIRRATREDGEHIARLALEAAEGIPAWFWNAIKQEGETVIDAGARRACSRESHFSFRNAHVALSRGAVAGLMLGYELFPLSTQAEIDEAPEFIRPILQLEQQVPGTFYINMLAVYPEFRGRGTGYALMNHAEAVAKSLGLDVMSLQVFNENHKALDFYLRLGYRQAAQLPVVPHECHPYRDQIYLMTKQLG